MHSTSTFSLIDDGAIKPRRARQSLDISLALHINFAVLN
jgi:hypothetical protein